MVLTLSPKMTQTAIKLAELSPAKQRLIIGATGLVGQTTIDALNPWVDEDTRKYAAVRTALRMIICTTSGVLSREVGQRIGEWLVKTGKVQIPKGISRAAFTPHVGSCLAIIGAVASIFLIDVPFINRALNFVMEKVFNTKTPDKYKSENEKQVTYNA